MSARISSRSTAQPDIRAKRLAASVDNKIDTLDDHFRRFAGDDQLMDKEEYKRFIDEANLSREQSIALWRLLDRDGSGGIDRREFNAALASLVQARQWIRYCPACVYTNTCTYCQECNDYCKNCTEESFCALHWSDHPARNRTPISEDMMGEERAKGYANTTEFLREQLIIRPLAWAYESPQMAWLNLAQKATLRSALRYHQLAAQEAEHKAKLEDEAAEKARRGEL